MLTFSKGELEKFNKLQKIKEFPGEIEKNLIEKTIKYINYVKWIPGLRMIAIGNSISMNNANNESDIDLFIVSSAYRMWTVRIIITIIFQILGVRKKAHLHKERFCLSFFCTINSLNFKNISIENDIYLYNRIAYLKPILNYGKTYELFIEENKKWCDFSIMENILTNNTKYIKYKSDNTHNLFLIGNLLEKVFKFIFFPKTIKSYENMGKPFGVIIDDEMLKFHDSDKRIEIKDKILK